uniref:Sema domain-containing protein n=1 Tax=Globodera rostochiensis TaxID=31243 RepID=A0A914HPX1_GLORO
MYTKIGAFLCPNCRRTLALCPLLAAFSHILLSLLFATVQSLSVPIEADNVFLSPGVQSFRSLLVNQRLSSLYVGSRDHFFRLWLYNVNDTSSAALFAHRQLHVRPEEREECLRLGNSERECDFWVRNIFLRSDNNLLICASQAMKPQLSVLDGQSLADLDEARTQIGICSQHDELNTTAVFSEFGNPDGLPALYSGIRTGLSLENHLIYRPPLMRDGREVHPALRTSIYDSNWLNEPQFVASHSVGPHVFFFFRETLTTDCYNCPSAGTGKGTTVSRVARICKNDLGGRQVLRQVWTSFVKARLNCSLPGGFYFDRIQSVSRVDESLTSAEASTSTGGDTFFYATFTAADQSALRASAVCVFSLNAINQLFDSGLFLEQSVSGSGSWWNPTPADQMPTSRPGTCQSDSRQLSDEELHFAKSHLLMAESVPSLGGSPLLHRHDVLLTQIVADVPDRDGRIVLFAYDLGRHSLLKMLHRLAFPSSARLLAIYRLPPSKKLHAMAILPTEYLYLATEEKIAQFRLGQCAVYGSNCAQCARDPYCSWSITRRQCFPTDSSHSDAVGWIVSRGVSAAATFSSVDEVSERCAKHAKAVTMTVFPGDSVHLECPDGEQTVQWRHNGRKVASENTAHLIHSRSGGLVLLNATEALEGVYECAMDASESAKAKVPLVIYSLKVDGEDCARPKSVEQFRSAQREWCRRMDAYRSNLSKWQSAHEANGQGGGDCGIGAETERRTAENFAA